jgi:hypothetical protein
MDDQQLKAAVLQIARVLRDFPRELHQQLLESAHMVASGKKTLDEVTCARWGSEPAGVTWGGFTWGSAKTQNKGGR